MRQLSVQSAAKTKRKRTTVFWKRPSFKPLVLSACFGLIAALVTYGAKTDLVQRASETLDKATINATASSGFILKDVLVEGRKNTPLKDLRTVVNLELDQPILQADPQVLRERIEALPWVASAIVERQLPDVIHIRLNEHRPVAMWQHDQTFSLINKDGEVILTGGDDIKVFAHLPLVVGEGAPTHVQSILAILRSEPELNKRVKAAVRVSDRRWDVVMENDFTIRLPELNPEKAWSRLALYTKENELFEKKLASVDMRLPDRILIKIDDLETIRKPLLGQDT